MRLAVLEWPPIIQTPLRSADRAGHWSVQGCRRKPGAAWVRVRRRPRSHQRPAWAACRDGVRM